MISFKQQIKENAAKNGVDLIGFASKERFADLDPKYNPFSIFPEGNTVILIGRRITRGTLRGVEEGSNFHDYFEFGYHWLDDEFVAQSCYDVVRFIEDNGWEAVPIFPNPKESYGMGVSVAEGRPAPNVTPDFDYAAVACGLGEISLHGEFLTPGFGPRQRFQMIITDAIIESDPIYEKNICTKCGKCAEVCPLKAINLDAIEKVTICGKTMEVAKVDYNLCRKCKNGALPNRLYASAKPDRLAAVCTRTCICQLEKNKVVDNIFENEFRQRDTWGIDIYDKNVKIQK